MNVTFLIPVLDERDTLERLADGIMRHTAPHEARILFIDDGSTDGSYEAMCRLRDRHDNVGVIRLRRNFGKSTALAVGFDRAEGDVVITMDGDLQDDPKEIPRFLAALENGHDVVVGWKKVRNDPWHKTLPSRVYNGLVAWLFKLDLHDVNCGYKAYRTEVVKRIDVYGELHRLIPVLAANLGYRVAEIPVEHHPRLFGRSKYGVERFSKGALDVVSVLFLSRYRFAPGHFFGKVGAGAILAGLVCAAGAMAGLAILDSVPLALAIAAVGAGLIGGGMGVLALGLVAELVLTQHPPGSPSLYVDEDAPGDET